MNELIPYLGWALLIVVFAAAAAFLARRGLWISRLKHNKTEIEFETALKGGNKPTKGRVPSIEEIDLTQELVGDCEALGLASGDVQDFILREAERHPILFLREFSSLPLVFSSHVLLLSWDRRRVKAERLLNREEAYPINDLWSSCLAAYRKATMLTYRQSGTDLLAASSEAKRSLEFYHRLVAAANDFLDGLHSQSKYRPAAYDSLPTLMEEAEFALVRDDFGTAIARMEALLSTVHKLILQHAPQGAGGATRAEQGEAPEFSTSTQSKARVLIVDDDRWVSDELSQYLRNEGYDVLATSDARTAMRALVDYTFDIVITDMRMSFDQGGFDGREVTLAAKTANPNTKVIVLTAYFQTTLMANTSCDLALSKTSDVWKTLPEQIAQLRRQQQSTSDKADEMCNKHVDHGKGGCSQSPDGN